jgi:folate-binding protein YgfZ
MPNYIDAPMTQTSCFTPLHHERLLAVRGPDAKKFLQGQLTCNLDYLDGGDASLGARCTPKGRMISSFRILQHEDGYLLAMDAGLLDAQLADLKKYGVFSKVTLAEESQQWQRIGVIAPPETLSHLVPELEARPGSTQCSESGIQVYLSAGRVELWVRAEHTERTTAMLRSYLTEAPLSLWLLAQVRAGEGQVFSNTQEAFIPQMINLQAVGGVSFKKGCYTGQEIVARMQYLGRLKRRLYRLELAAAEVPAPGTELFSPVHGSSVGEVVLAAPNDAQVELLAVLQDDAATDGRIHIGSIDGPALKLLDLPYVLDRDQEIRR